MRPPQSALRSSCTAALARCRTAVSWTTEAARRATTWVWTILLGVTARLRSHAGLDTARDALGASLRGAVVEPLRYALFGRRAAVSLLVCLLTLPLALGSAWWVDTTLGYATLVELITGTWYGTNPESGVFLAAAVLVGLGAVSAGLNSGLVPTSALVVAPVFGAALTRYGTTVPTYGGRTTVVSLPEAVAYAASVGVAVGVPIAVGGFLLGVGLRRAGVVLADAGGPSRPAEQA